MRVAGRALGIVTVALALGGCGILPDPMAGPGLPIHVARGGLDVAVTVTGWSRPAPKVVLCIRPITNADLSDLLPTPAQKPGCLEMTTVAAGAEVVASYSFRSASAIRLADFAEAAQWHVVVIGLDQETPRFIQMPIAGGPIEVQ